MGVGYDVALVIEYDAGAQPAGGLDDDDGRAHRLHHRHKLLLELLGEAAPRRSRPWRRRSATDAIAARGGRGARAARGARCGRRAGRGRGRASAAGKHQHQGEEARGETGDVGCSAVSQGNGGSKPLGLETPQR